MRNAGLHEAQAGIKIAVRNINNLRYTDNTTLLAESEEELKVFLMKLKEKSKKVDLKLSIQKTRIIYPEKAIIQKDTCTPVFTVALFKTSRTWKQPRCPSTDE